MPELNISREKVAFLIDKAREFDAKDLPAGLEDGSNPGDDREIEVLEDDPSEDSVLNELASFIRALNEDEQIDLVALIWLGRGDATIEEWDDLRARSAERREPPIAAHAWKRRAMCSANPCSAISWPRASTGSASPGPTNCRTRCRRRRASSARNRR